MSRDLLKTTSDKKQKLIDAKNASPFVKGETVIVPEKLVSSFPKEGETAQVEVIKVNKKTLIVEHAEYRNATEYKIKHSDVVGRDLLRVGANVFEEKYTSVRPVAFTLESILFGLDFLGDKTEFRKGFAEYKMEGIPIGELNWNPFVYNKDGDKEHYQRDFVWSLKDKQLLIDSVYYGIDCGKILIRKRAWKDLEKMAKNGEKELFFNDVVDGKQRLDAIRGFIMNEYADSQGNYYNDLSFISQHSFTQHQLFSYAEMGDSVTDEETIYQFLKMNFTGVPQSEEHLASVKEISKKF